MIRNCSKSAGNYLDLGVKRSKFTSALEVLRERAIQIYLLTYLLTYLKVRIRVRVTIAKILFQAIE